MTIEQRALQKYPVKMSEYSNGREYDFNESDRITYIEGATDEREILIEKMSGWLHLNADDYVRIINYDGTYGVDTQMITDLRKYLGGER